MESSKILHGDIDKRFIVVCHRDKIQYYALFDSEKEAFQWWQDHKTPFFETDRPKGWGVAFVLTYDKLEQKVIQWNTLYLNEEIVNECIKEMNEYFDFGNDVNNSITL